AFVLEIPHEKLADAEAPLIDAAHSDQEGVGSGPAGEASGLGVEERPTLRMRPQDPAAGEGIEQIFMKPDQAGDLHTAVAAMGLEKLLGFEVRAGIGFDHFAAHQFFDEIAGRTKSAGQGGWSRWSCILAVDALDLAPKLH